MAIDLVPNWVTIVESEYLKAKDGIEYSVVPMFEVSCRRSNRVFSVQSCLSSNYTLDLYGITNASLSFPHLTASIWSLMLPTHWDNGYLAWTMYPIQNGNMRSDTCQRCCAQCRILAQNGTISLPFRRNRKWLLCQ